MQEFKTIKNDVSNEIVEKKSRFIANIFYVETEELAKEKIKEIKSKYYDARHNCYAYRVLTESGIKDKSSDDGEPGGTAGAPILNAITKNELVNVLVIVTRYFGGILLGAGGLVRAYANAASLALEAAHIVTYEEYSVYTLSCDYGEYNKINFELEGARAIIDNLDFADKVNMRFAVRKPIADALIRKIAELSGGKLTPDFIELRFDAEKKG